MWQALTDADLTARYWGHANVSDWQPGSAGSTGASTDRAASTSSAGAPRRATDAPGASPSRTARRRARGNPSVVTFLVEPHQDIVRLTVTHEHLPDMDEFNGVSSGWPAVLANLKSLLETGDVLPQAPWEMPASHA